MWCAVGNNNYMCHVCAKGVLDSNFDFNLKTLKAFFDKISIFTITHKNRSFKSN